MGTLQFAWFGALDFSQGATYTDVNMKEFSLLLKERTEVWSA
jgi:hypothetical protein